MSRARRWIVGTLVAASAAPGAGHARTGGGGVAAADAKRPVRILEAVVTGPGGGLEFRLSEGRDVGRGAGTRRASDGRAALRRRDPPRPRPPAAPRPASAGGALRDPRRVPAAAAHRAQRARALPAAERARAPGRRRHGPARDPAPHARGRRAPRAAPVGHVLAAHGRPRLAVGPRPRSSPGSPLPAAARRVALGGDDDPGLRARRPFPDGDGVPGRGPGRHARRLRRDPGERRELVLLDAPAAGRGATPGGRTGPPRRADARGLRPGRRPDGGGRLAARPRGRSHGPRAPRHRGGGGSGRGRRSRDEGRPCRACRRVPGRALHAR